jgi:malonyl-CoA O-methyltransferase
MTALSARDAYRVWAPSYSDETAISYIEDQLVSAMTPDLSSARLLDAGCGTARRLRASGAAHSVGLDESGEMLSAGIERDGPIADAGLFVGDVRAMPLADRSFDVVWCRLVLGHLDRIDEAYAELARVADAGATIIVSDFHPAAYEAGHRRSFRAVGTVIEAEHHVHDADDHIRTAQAVGLTLNGVRDGTIGNDVLPFYERAGRTADHALHIGLPVVLALSFRQDR